MYYYTGFRFPDTNTLFVIAIRLKVRYRFHIDVMLFFVWYRNITLWKAV